MQLGFPDLVYHEIPKCVLVRIDTQLSANIMPLKHQMHVIKCIMYEKGVYFWTEYSLIN
jgi:hypothetical protein